MGERLLAVLIGGMCIILGYLLFTHLPQTTNSEGKIVLPGGISIWLSRVGPGVFFAVFGAIIVGTSFVEGIKIKSIESGLSEAKTQEFIGVTSTKTNTSVADQEQRLTEARTQIFTLNYDWPKALQPNLHTEDRNTVEVARDYSKRQILRAVWLEKWGPFSEFEKWINSGAKLPAPSVIRDPTEIYFLGKEALQ
jgi:hypothetical protein